MNNTRFADLEIRIFKNDAQSYSVEIRLDGQQELGHGYMTTEVLNRVSLGDARRDGQNLFEILFADPPLRAAWNKALGLSTLRRIRLWIDTEAAELHTLPWELLHDGKTWLAADNTTPFSRYLEHQSQWGKPIRERPLRMLVVISNPSDLAIHGLSPLDVDAERAQLESALHAFPVLMVFMEPPITIKRIESELREGDYHILHLVSHGIFTHHDQHSALCLEDAIGRMRVVLDTEICGVFQRIGPQLPQLVFLAACKSAEISTLNVFTGLAPRLIAAGVPSVVGMRDKLTISAETTLTPAFYTELFRSGAVDRALNAARSLLLTEESNDVAVPTLLMRLKAGQLLKKERKNVSFDISIFKRIVNWFTQSFQGLFYYRKRYQQHLYEHHRYFDVAELIAQNKFALESKSVFVELDLVPMASRDVQPTVILNERDTHLTQVGLREGQRTIWNYLQAKELSHQHVVVLAGPGYGKTTLLKHIALTLIEDKIRGEHNNMAKLLPVLLSLRDHASKIRMTSAEGAGKPFTFTLPQAIQDNIFKYKGPEAPPRWFSRWLIRGHCFVLLDGLDEVIHPTLRKQVVRWIKEQMLAYPKSRFIITSRPYGYYENPLDRAMVLGVMNFGLQQIQQFIENWYQSVCIMEAQEDTISVRKLAKTKAQDLLQRLQETSALYSLATNPLLLTMIVHVHHYGDILPKQRARLYESACNVLLSRKAEQQRPSPQGKQRILQSLAYVMMCKRVQEIPTPEAIAIIESVLSQGYGDISGAKFLKNVENLSGLVWECERETYSFAHLTFQEYLAAVHVRESKLIESLTQQVDDSWWHETIRLYCAQTDEITPIIQACLSDDRISDATFRLALLCVDEALKIPPEVQQRLEMVLHRCFDDAGLKNIVATALATIRRERMLRVSQNKFLDSRLITHAEYLLFLLDCRTLGKHHHPDHWRTLNFPMGDIIRPVVGVRPSDALEFCHWLDEQDSIENWHYRLPTIAETEQEKIFGVKPDGDTTANYWITGTGQFQTYGGMKLRITTESILQKVIPDVQHKFSTATITNLFFKRPELVTSHIVATITAKYDFDRSHTRALLAKVRNQLESGAILQSANAIASSLEPIIAEYHQRSIEYNDQCEIINKKILEHEAAIADYERQGDEKYAEIEENLAEINQQLDKQIAGQKAAIADCERQRDAIYAQIEENRAQIDQQLDAWIKEEKAAIADCERQRDAIYAQIEENRAQIDRQLNEWIAEQPEFAAEYEEQRKQKYAQLDANRDFVRQDCNVCISNRHANIANYEEQCRQSHIKLDSDRDVVRHDSELAISNHYAAIAKYEEQRQLRHAQLNANRDSVRQDCDAHISVHRDTIADYQRQRRERQVHFDGLKDRIKRWFEEQTAPVRSVIAHNQNLLRSCRNSEQDAIAKARKLRSFSNEIPASLKNAQATLPKVKGFLNDYFNANREKYIDELEGILYTARNLSRDMVMFLDVNVSIGHKGHFKEFADIIKQMLISVKDLHTLIMFSSKLESELKLACQHTQHLQLGKLKTMHVARKVQQQQRLAISFELAYSFLRLHSRSLIEESKSQEVLDRLCYIRKCALILGMELLNCNPQVAENLDTARECFRTYVELCILEERIRGNISAIEGIRVVREQLK
ncbi:MAG: CHAT domain-containing protein [Anaerolineae bacterium]|nr:CHAT domain-containing protein [Anaerolineae bacterium]